MADKVKFELVSPEKILVSEEVDMVVVPGAEGNFGVLPNHAPLISSVRPGVIDIYTNGGVSERIFIAGGFAEVTPLRCTVLADEALQISAIDKAKAEAELSAAQTKLREVQAAGGPPPGVTLRILERDIDIAVAKLDALGAAPAR